MNFTIFELGFEPRHRFTFPRLIDREVCSVTMTNGVEFLVARFDQRPLTRNVRSSRAKLTYYQKSILRDLKYCTYVNEFLAHLGGLGR